MPRYTLQADVTFEATDDTEAVELLSYHLANLVGAPTRPLNMLTGGLYVRRPDGSTIERDVPPPPGALDVPPPPAPEPEPPAADQLDLNPAPADPEDQEIPQYNTLNP